MNPAFSNIFDRITKSTYVVLGKAPDGKYSLLQDPGLGRPWSSKNYKLAQFHASQNNGQAMTADEAFKHLIKDRPDFEDELFKRVEAKTKQFAADVHAQRAINQRKPKH